MGENEISNLNIEMGQTIDTSILIEDLDPNHIPINQIPIILNIYHICKPRSNLDPRGKKKMDRAINIT